MNEKRQFFVARKIDDKEDEDDVEWRMKRGFDSALFRNVRGPHSINVYVCTGYRYCVCLVYRTDSKAYDYCVWERILKRIDRPYCILSRSTDRTLY
jgi:hypothetical protein